MTAHSGNQMLRLIDCLYLLFKTTCGAGLLDSSWALTFCRPAVSASICFSNRSTLRCSFRNSLSNIALFDGRPLATITSAEIDDWLRSLPVAPVARNHYRSVAVLAFNFAISRGYAVGNPAPRSKSF